jgi:hypothetical protein
LALHLDFTLIMLIVISKYCSKFCYSRNKVEGPENFIAMPLLGVIMAIGAMARRALHCCEVFWTPDFLGRD